MKPEDVVRQFIDELWAHTPDWVTEESLAPVLAALEALVKEREHLYKQSMSQGIRMNLLRRKWVLARKRNAGLVKERDEARAQLKLVIDDCNRQAREMYAARCVLADALKSITQQFHQAHHEGEPATCNRGTCSSARKALEEPHD
jgi:hypothetical protein